VLVAKLVCFQAGRLAMLKWTASVVLATKNIEQEKKPLQRSTAHKMEQKVTNAATHVTTAAPNINRTPFTCKDAIIVVLCAILLVQTVAIVFLITKLM